MTTASFKHKGNMFEVLITGHAGYNTSGPDIVCAACSALACTLLQCILALEDEGAARELHTDEKDGTLYVNITAQDWARERTEATIGVISSGFALLGDKYPENVRVGYSHSACRKLSASSGDMSG